MWGAENAQEACLDWSISSKNMNGFTCQLYNIWPFFQIHDVWVSSCNSSRLLVLDAFWIHRQLVFTWHLRAPRRVVTAAISQSTSLLFSSTRSYDHVLCRLETSPGPIRACSVFVVPEAGCGRGKLRIYKDGFFLYCWDPVGLSISSHRYKTRKKRAFDTLSNKAQQCICSLFWWQPSSLASASSMRSPQLSNAELAMPNGAPTK